MNYAEGQTKFHHIQLYMYANFFFANLTQIHNENHKCVTNVVFPKSAEKKPWLFCFELNHCWNKCACVRQKITNDNVVFKR